MVKIFPPKNKNIIFSANDGFGAQISALLDSTSKSRIFEEKKIEMTDV